MDEHSGKICICWPESSAHSVLTRGRWSFWKVSLSIQVCYHQRGICLTVMWHVQSQEKMRALQQQVSTEQDAARRERQVRSQLEFKFEETQQQASLLSTQAADLQADCTLLQQRLSLAQTAASQAEEQAAKRSANMSQMALKGTMPPSRWQHSSNPPHALHMSPGLMISWSAEVAAHPCCKQVEVVHLSCR